jgi:hypothetical protein
VASIRANRDIKATSVVVAAKDQVSSDLAGEAVILNLRTGMYYGLNPVGARIWALLVTPTRVEDIRDTIVQQYDVEVDRCERDVLGVLHQLAAHGLVEKTDAADQ